MLLLLVLLLLLLAVLLLLVVLILLLLLIILLLLLLLLSLLRASSLSPRGCESGKAELEIVLARELDAEFEDIVDTLELEGSFIGDNTAACLGELGSAECNWGTGVSRFPLFRWARAQFR